MHISIPHHPPEEPHTHLSDKEAKLCQHVIRRRGLGLPAPGPRGREVLRARVPGDGRKGCLSHPLPTHAPAPTGDPHHPCPLCQDPLIIWWEFCDRQAMRMGGGFGPSCQAIHQDCGLGRAKD